MHTVGFLMIRYDMIYSRFHVLVDRGNYSVLRRYFDWGNGVWLMGCKYNGNAPNPFPVSGFVPYLPEITHHLASNVMTYLLRGVPGALLSTTSNISTSSMQKKKKKKKKGTACSFKDCITNY